MKEEKFSSADLTGGQLNAVVKKLGGHEGALKFLRDELVVQPATQPPLLELVTTIPVPAVIRFAAADHFQHGEEVKGVKCYLWSNFLERFGNKVEENVDRCIIHVHKLLKNSRDLGIRAAIGEEYEETKLAHLWHLLSLQPKGEAGTLLVNGWANIFYIRDAEDFLWAVGAHWLASSREWNLRASSVEYPGGWRAGYFVFSR